MSLITAIFVYLSIVTVATAYDQRSKILGGNEADPHEFPYMLSLEHDGTHEHFCGGGIIDEYWAITAAHCRWFVPKNRTMQIKAGKHSLSTIEDSEQLINVSKIFVHHQYPGGKVVAAHDLALLKLEKPLVFNDYVQPITLPEKDVEASGEVILSGWGTSELDSRRTDKLRQAHFSIIDFDTCKKVDEELTPPSPLTETMLCTESSVSHAFACPGDSGSPLIQDDGHGRDHLVGVFSWLANPCGRKGAPSVFTKISYYIDWIEETIANNSD